MRSEQIALQLYTVRELLAGDLGGTLGRVAAAGYEAVELAGLPPIEPADLADLLVEHGLIPIASHEPLERLRANLDGAIARLAALGIPRAIVPSLPDEDRASAEAIRRVAAELGILAARLGEHGIELGYHNHAFEFEAIDGTTVWRVFRDALPATVALEIDVFWASVGGQDPAGLIADATNPVRLLHMKDRADGPTPRDAPPGSGLLHWAEIVDAGRAAGVEWYVVEQDEPGDAIADVTAGLHYLRGLAGRTGPDLT